MPQTEESEIVSPSATNPSIQISELPGRPYRVTMEVPLFLTMMGITLSGAAISNIVLYRTCVHSLGHTHEECREFLNPHRNNETNHLEKDVQQYTTYVMTIKVMIESLGPAIMAFFLGVWSDTHGRKPLVVWPLLGLSFMMMMTVVYALVDAWGPWWYILTAIPYSLTGGYAVLFTGAFCYINDITSKDKISLRMLILEAIISVGGAVGSVASSYLLSAVGNEYLLVIVTALFVGAYCFTNVYVRESLTGAIEGGVTTVMDLLLVKEMFRECFKRRPNNMRSIILLLTVANSMSVFILYGLLGLDYMYSREKLHWALKDYTSFSAVNTVIAFIGGFVGLGVLQKLLGIGDLIIVLVAFASSAAEYITKALATMSWHMYFGASISAFKGLSAPLIRALLTKILPVEDIAKVFALMCAVEGICPLLAPATFNSLYASTIATVPGAIYYLSASICGACFIMIGFVQYYICKSSSSAYTPLEQST